MKFHLKATLGLCVGLVAIAGTSILVVAEEEGVQTPAQSPIAVRHGVAALGRLEPAGGVVRVAAPTTPLSLSGSVLARLLIAEGDFVEAGQLLAESYAAVPLQAAVDVAAAELAVQRRAAAASQSRAEEACVRADVQAREAERRSQLLERDLASHEEAEQSAGDAQAQAASCTAARANAEVAAAAITLAEAQLARRQAERDRAYVRAPFAGQVLKVLAEPGELVAAEGLLELGRVSQMYAIAEVHETDVQRVAVGQAAIVSSAALTEKLQGTVDFIRPKVQKQDEIGTDPAAAKDARIVEVGVRLAQSDLVSGFTNLQVEVVIEP